MLGHCRTTVITTTLALMIIISSVFAALWDRWIGDMAGIHWFQGILNPSTEPILGASDFLGHDFSRIFLALVGIVWFLIIRRPKIAGLLTVVLLAIGILVQILKWVVQRPRPEVSDQVESILAATNNSYPSGHVAFLALFFGVLAYIAYREWKTAQWRRIALLTLLMVPVALIGPARISTTLHWPSDVIGGYVIALLGVQIFAILYNRFGDNRHGKCS